MEELAVPDSPVVEEKHEHVMPKEFDPRSPSGCISRTPIQVSATNNYIYLSLYILHVAVIERSSLSLV